MADTGTREGAMGDDEGDGSLTGVEAGDVEGGETETGGFEMTPLARTYEELETLSTVIVIACP